MGAPLLSRRLLRALGASAAFAAAAVGCQPPPTGPGIPEDGPLRIRPVLVSAFDPTTLDLDSIAVVIRRSTDRSVVHDAVLAFEAEAILAWVLTLADLPDVLDVEVQVRSGTVPMFEGELQDIDIIAASAASESTVYEVMLQFVGPGHDAASVDVIPGDVVLMFGQTLRFQAEVRNAAGDIIPNPILEWESSNASVAAIDADGDLTAPHARGSLRVRARAGNGVSGSAGVRFQPVVSTLTVVEGHGAATPVAQSVTVRVKVLGEDGLGVEDVDVVFAAPIGASVSSATVTTDADGVASTQATVGTLPGPYEFTATVAGPSPASIVITAQPGSAAALVVDVAGSTSEPAAPLAPGVRVRVVDAYGNLTPSTLAISVSLGTNPTGALLSGTTLVPAQSGQATFTNLMLDRHGSGYTLVASASGLPAVASGPFDVVQIPRSVTVAPSFRQVNALGGMGAPFTAVARDAVGAPIVGQSFAWSTTNSAVATVDSTGAGNALANGLVNVSATAGGVTGSALVMIQQQPHSVTVTPPSRLLVSIGEQVALSATVVDANGFPVAGHSVTWSSSAGAFVTVDASGLATGVQNGSAQIEATSGSVSGAATITLQQVVTSVAVTPGSGSLAALQQQLQLAAEGRDANGFLVSGATFDWSSDDGTIASVSPTGLVTALANGGTNIRATTGGASGSAAVSVAQTVASVEVDPPSSTLTALAAQVQLTATAADGNGHPVAGVAFTWSSNASGVASVDASGLVTAEANGPATITAEVGGVGATADVLVSQVPTDVIVAPASVSLSALAATASLDATVVDANGFTVPGQTVTWSAPPAGAASVDPTGTVTAIANGSTVVTASSGPLSGTADVTVAQRVATLTLTVSCPGSGSGPALVSGPQAVVPPTSCDTLAAFGDEALVTADARDANGFLIAAPSITWTSLTPAFASVDQGGLVVASGNGTALIQAESDGVVEQVEIVVRQVVVSLAVDPTDLDLEVGEQGQLTALPTDANGFLVADALIAWFTESGVASVDGSGLVTALAPGTARVWATHLDLQTFATVRVQ